jgi:hypothetical protein
MTVFGDGTVGFDHTLSVPLIDSGWRHVAWTYDRLNSTIFLDGVLSSTQAHSQEVQTGFDPVRFGAEIGPFGTIDAYKSGKIDELRISKIMRYLANFEPARRVDADSDALALWHFDEGSGTQVLDVSSNLHRGQVLSATISWATDDGYGGKFCSVPTVCVAP